MLSHLFESFIFIERALLDLIRWVFIIFYCSAYVWRKIWANMLVHVFLKLPHIEPHSLEFLLYLVSLPSVFSASYCPPHYCECQVSYKNPTKKALIPTLLSSKPTLGSSFGNVANTSDPPPAPSHKHLVHRVTRENPFAINCQMFLGPLTPVVHLFLNVQAVRLCYHCCVVSGYCCWLLDFRGVFKC